ncbi:MAG: hypothetical protein K8I27_11605 [Planctomycetes bacterium]|nr:hypothetical protein [Planctomycetota bacterium]
MRHLFTLALLMAFVTFTTQLGASTLSVVPLAEALQNPELANGDADSPAYKEAVSAVSSLMLNQPDDDGPEPKRFRARLAALAKHRDTRVGKLFFGALEAVPGLENLPAGAEVAGINATWPLALGASIRVRAEFTKRGEDWLVSALEVTIDGVAGSPVAGMAPYFGGGEARDALLDLQAIDYVVGRDADDRRRPESERKPFDYDEALGAIFASEDGAFAALLESLNEKVRSSVLRQDRIKALTPHLASQAEVDAMIAGDADDDKREEFWNGIFAQLDNGLKSARPVSMPSRPGAEVRATWRVGGNEAAMAGIRLGTGEIALRGKALSEKTNEEGDGGGN